MYRFLISTLMLLNAVSSAPQEFKDNSNVTYVKIQPLVDPNTVANLNDSIVEESKIEKIPLTIPGNVAYNIDITSHVENDDVTTEVDQSETTTDIPETTQFVPVKRTTEKVTEPPTTFKPVKPSFIKPKPKYVSKLSYYNKASSFDGNAYKNLVERVGKRKYKSNCRCEKIWNCPKLQITVPRCPDEYFLCCF